MIRLKLVLKKKIIHTEIKNLIIMALMVFCTTNYSLLCSLGIKHYNFNYESRLFPEVLIVVLLVKNLISAPLSYKLYNSFRWLRRGKYHFVIPILIISVNIIIVVGIITYFTNNYRPHHYLESYLWSCFRITILAFPLFFFLIRPFVQKMESILKLYIS